jgi:hypothetical protein
VIAITSSFSRQLQELCGDQCVRLANLSYNSFHSDRDIVNFAPKDSCDEKQT